MNVVLVDYFSQYQMIVAWEQDGAWQFYKDISGFHPVIGIPEYGEALSLALEDFINGQEDIAELGFVRLIKSDEDDPEKFNARKRPPVYQAVRLEMMGKMWGVCARVVFFGEEPQVRVMDDADGKLLITVYGGNKQYVGMDFRFFLPMMSQAGIPGLVIADVSHELKEALQEVGDSDALFRVFQERL